ncbi:hypothetical protein J6590_099014, partial [Homalodisca vitripennis]
MFLAKREWKRKLAASIRLWDLNAKQERVPSRWELKGAGDDPSAPENWDNLRNSLDTQMNDVIKATNMQLVVRHDPHEHDVAP